MNKDDDELFAKIGAVNKKSSGIIMIKRKREQGIDFDECAAALKEVGVNKIKFVRAFYISGCPNITLIYGSTDLKNLVLDKSMADIGNKVNHYINVLKKAENYNYSQTKVIPYGIFSYKNNLIPYVTKFPECIDVLKALYYFPDKGNKLQCLQFLKMKLPTIIVGPYFSEAQASKKNDSFTYVKALTRKLKSTWTIEAQQDYENCARGNLLGAAPTAPVIKRR
jgi:hypothetical protein